MLGCKNFKPCYTQKDMQTLASILPWAQVILAVILVTLIMMQKSESGLGAAFGGGDSGSSFNQKRGMEKVIFQATIVVAILFVISALTALFI